MRVISIVCSISLAAVLSACVGSSSHSGGNGVVPRPQAAIDRANRLNTSPFARTAISLRSRTGTGTLNGLVVTDIASLPPGQGSRSIVGQSSLTVNFDTRAVTGRATNFWEVPGGTDVTGQIRITEWFQGLNGSLTQTGQLQHRGGNSAIVLDSNGSLTGTLEIGGRTVAGTFNVNADDNELAFRQRGVNIYAVGNGLRDGTSDLEVTFTPSGGGRTVRVCYNDSCPTTGAGFTVGHVLELN